jgi:hypothetical protein
VRDTKPHNPASAPWGQISNFHIAELKIRDLTATETVPPRRTCDPTFPAFARKSLQPFDLIRGPELAGRPDRCLFPEDKLPWQPGMDGPPR